MHEALNPHYPHCDLACYIAVSAIFASLLFVLPRGSTKELSMISGPGNMFVEASETINHPIYKSVGLNRFLGPLPRALDAKISILIFFSYVNALTPLNTPFRFLGAKVSSRQGVTDQTSKI